MPRLRSKRASNWRGSTTESALPLLSGLVLASVGSGCEKPRMETPCTVGGDVVPPFRMRAVDTPTEEALREKLGDREVAAVTWVVPDGGLSDVGNFVERHGPSVKLRGVARTGRPSEKFRFVATALVDLKPVSSHYRAEALALDGRATGVGVETTSSSVAFEVHVPIPDDGRAHEIETFFDLAPAGSSDGADADVRRWIVGNPGEKTPDRRCQVSSAVPWQQNDELTRREGHSGSIALAGADGVDVSIKNMGRDVAATLLVDGEPSDEARIFRPRGDGAVVARTNFAELKPPVVASVVPVWQDVFSTSTDAVWSSNFASSNYQGNLFADPPETP